MNILKATNEHIPKIAKLFDLYRQFYECETDIDLATKFITDRIVNDESIIFLAIEDGLALGFVQLYPSFCSVAAIKKLSYMTFMWITQAAIKALGKN